MQLQRNNMDGLRKHAIACALASAFTVLAPVQVWAGPPSATPPAPSHGMKLQHVSGAARGPARVYSVINLGSEAGAVALLNERGHAAFGAIGHSGMSHGFFDGERLHDVGSLGGSYTWVWGLNNNGVLVGESEDAEERSNILAFSWTLGGGMRALPGTTVSRGRGVNDGGYIVGQTPSPSISARAIGWNPDATVTPLGPIPFSLSEAFAVNQAGISTGFTDQASGKIHATLWDKAGNTTDLGTLGGQLAFGMHINSCSAVAGESDNSGNERQLGFFWSRDSGMVPINAPAGGFATVAGLSNRGEVVGNMIIGERSVAYQWTLGRGVVDLPAGSATRSRVLDINNHSAMVGQLERHAGEGGGSRAVLWPALNAPIDLNTRLHRPPAGLVLELGAAINDEGVILAHSNAGLVMLRPGKRGTDAPVLGPLAGLPELLEVGQDLALTLDFVDQNPGQTHSASATWNDGCADAAPTLRQLRRGGQVRLQHQFCAPGLFTVTVRITDSGGRSTQLQRELLVETPTLASISGKGMLGTGGGAQRRSQPDAPLRFALWSPLAKGAQHEGRGGPPFVILSGPFLFHSKRVISARAAGQQARLEGTGRLNGRPGYRFVLEADVDGAKRGPTQDRMRVRVSHVDRRTGREVLDYDNATLAKASGAAAPDRTLVLEGGLRLRH